MNDPNSPQDPEAGATTADANDAQKDECDRLRDQLLRNQAEFVNYQKRSKAQADIDRQYAVGNLAKDLLDILDNFDRGIDAARSSGTGGVVEGFEMVHKQLLATLAKHGVEPIEALGQPFDPNYHEAIVQKPATAEYPEGTVATVLSRGYKIKDRVLRPAKVAVAS